MDMAILQFYRNQYRYPHYSETLTAYGSPMDCTPVGVNLKSGSLRVRGTFSDFMACNYLSLNRDGKTIFAWIDDVKFLTEDSFEVAYHVDAWRTYKSKINLGTQFIKRSPTPTYLKDPLLGSTQPYVDIDSVRYIPAYSFRRIAVVQVRASAGEVFSNAPVQPTPYQFYVTDFNVSSWQDSAPLVSLMSALAGGAETTNIVTIYSIPYMNIASLPSNPLILDTGSSTQTINGFKCITNTTDAAALLYLETPFVIPNPQELMKVEHSVQVVIPEAGIIHIPDELLVNPNLKLRQDVDLFSGASNYMIVTGTDDASEKYYDISVRGSSISSIPIVSDPLDTYLSQNQNALATSLIGDVASVVAGGALLATPAGAALGGTAAALGGGMSVTSGLNGLMNTASNLGDVANRVPSNPPAFLGTATANHFNQQFWVVTRKAKVTNEANVHNYFGYPYNMIDTLALPTSGYIKTEGCSVFSTDGSVPRWALDEINATFNSGILVH